MMKKIMFVTILLSVITFIVVKSSKMFENNTENFEVSHVEDTFVVLDRAVIYEDITFSEEAFKKQIVAIGIRFPDIVMAQAILESGHFTSGLFVNHKNPFGMMIAKKRPTLAKKGAYPFASYKEWKHSIMDYAYYQSVYMSKYTTEDSYLKRLGEVYAEDPKYVSKLKTIIKKNE